MASRPSRISALLYAAQTLQHHESEVSVWKRCYVCFCFAHHPVAGYVIELHRCVLEAFFKKKQKTVPDIEFLSPYRQTDLESIHPEYVLTITNSCTASPNIAHTGQHLW